jgi:CysZ protein
MKKILGGFGTVAGATYPARALGLFWRYPGLRGYIIVPVIVNLVIAIAIYGGFLFFGFELITEIQTDLVNWFERLIANLPQWLSILQYGVVFLAFLLRFLLIIIALVVTGFAITQLGVLLGAPWYGQLSEQLEKIRTGTVEIVEVSIFKDLSRAILYELKKLVLMAIVGGSLGIISFFPGLGTTIFTIGWFILTTIIVGLDFLDSTLERRRFKFRRKLKILFTALPASGSFALVCVFLISIPLINLVTIPLCVASGTLFVCDRILPRLKNEVIRG